MSARQTVVKCVPLSKVVHSEWDVNIT